MQPPHWQHGTRRPLEWASNLFASAFEWVQSIETASEISRIVRIRTAPWLSLWERQVGMQGKAFFAQIYQTSRERSKKTASVFLVGSRRSGGKSKSLRARFLFATFSFGEAKEKVGRQSQICRRVSAFCRLPSSGQKIHRSACSPRINSGVVPQQPPRRLAPSSLSARMCRTKSSGPML